MRRPLLLAMLPDVLKEKAFYRFFNHRQQEFAPLFRQAPLRFSSKSLMFNLLPGDVISGMIALTGFYELSLTRQIVSLARRGGLFVDVGANLGYFSILWASASPNATAICFEASPRNITALTTNIEGNSLSSRIKLVPKAAGREVGSARFDVGPLEQTGWGGITKSESTSTIDVPLTRLDLDLAKENIEVLKIDVEGADTWVLMGCEKLLQEKRIKRIYFEQNVNRMDLLGIKSHEAQEFLSDHGYSSFPIDRKGGEWLAMPAQSS